MGTARTSYEALIAHVQQTAWLDASLRLLSWDQETVMPTGAGAVGYRARQIAQLSRLVHDRATDPRVKDWLGDCESDREWTGDPHSPTATNVREIRRDYDRAVKLPASLVERFSAAAVVGKHAWGRARMTNDFGHFQPHLEEIVGLCRSKAECWGVPAGGEPWDALADWHEPGMSARQVGELFASLRPRLVGLVDRARSGKALNVRVPVDQQRAFTRLVAEKLGFDFTRGRCDESQHPFCLPLHRDDVRMTSRFRDDALLDGLGSTMHETGHGLYNQNLPGGERIDTPSGEPLRYAIHESQARLIENHIGRSRSFWAWCGPAMREHFPGALKGVSDEDLFQGCNVVERSLIRTEADELTYNLHILVRFELERALIRGDLEAGGLPGAWSEKYREYLGVAVPDDARGCLQDIHWSQGAIGYFPTYTMGNLYAAQFYEAADAAVGGLDAHLARGDFRPLVEWLTVNVHRHGRCYSPEELCRMATGSGLTADPFVHHLKAKLEAVEG